MGQTVHVLPVRDRVDHDSDRPTGCPCHPSVEYVGSGGFVVAHNAVDKRELRERKAAG
jgi:hypothetical protein